MSFPIYCFPSYPPPLDSPGVTSILAIVSNAGYGNSALATLIGDVPTAGENADAVLDEEKGTHAGLLAKALPDVAAGSAGGLPVLNEDLDVSAAIAHVVGGTITADINGDIGGLADNAKQDVRDALTLGTIITGSDGSVDKLLTDILEDIETTLPATLALIKVKTDLICAGQVTVEAPVDADGDATVDQGYDYYAVDGRGLSWTDETPATWPDLSGATAVFVCGSLEVTCTITNPTGPATIAVDLSSTQTSSLAGGVHPFKIEVTLANGHLILQIRGELTVIV